MKEGLGTNAGVERYSGDRWDARVWRRHRVNSNLAKIEARDYRPMSLRNSELRSDPRWVRLATTGPV